jgi:DNA-binding response OmpR family regulator
MANILLVDFDADSALRSSQTLQRAGFHVDVAAPGLQCEDLTADVVVLSVARLQGSMIRVVSKGRAVPRIAISSEEHDEMRGEEFGCAAVLVRPVLYDQLVAAVRRVVRASTAAAAV